MKNVIKMCVVFLFILSSCKKENKKSGFCYCEFANGEKQEYDLTDLTREEQIEKCNTHDKNAANFGGVCDLE